jgi:hypothetical protein
MAEQHSKNDLDEDEQKVLNIFKYLYCIVLYLV